MIAACLISFINVTPARQATAQSKRRYVAFNQRDVQQHFARRESLTGADRRVPERSVPDQSGSERSTRTATMRSPASAHAPQKPPVMRFRETSERSEPSPDDLNVLFAKDLKSRQQQKVPQAPRGPQVPSRSKPATKFQADLKIDRNPSKTNVRGSSESVKETADESNFFGMLLPQKGDDSSTQHVLSASAGGKSPFQLTRKAGVGLGIALAAFFGLVWLLKKTGSGTQSQGAIPQQVVQVLGRAPLNTKQNMQLVRLGDKILLLAISTTGTESLGEITDRDEVDAITEICLSRNSRRIKETFRQTLQRVRGDRSTQQGDQHGDQHAMRGTQFAA